MPGSTLCLDFMDYEIRLLSGTHMQSIEPLAAPIPTSIRIIFDDITSCAILGHHQKIDFLRLGPFSTQNDQREILRFVRGLMVVFISSFDILSESDRVFCNSMFS